MCSFYTNKLKRIRNNKKTLKSIKIMNIKKIIIYTLLNITKNFLESLRITI